MLFVLPSYMDFYLHASFRPKAFIKLREWIHSRWEWKIQGSYILMFNQFNSTIPFYFYLMLKWSLGFLYFPINLYDKINWTYINKNRYRQKHTKEFSVSANLMENYDFHLLYGDGYAWYYILLFLVKCLLKFTMNAIMLLMSSVKFHIKWRRAFVAQHDAYHMHVIKYRFLNIIYVLKVQTSNIQ